MSFQIPTSKVNQFNRNVMHLAQQKASRLLPFITQTTQNAELQFYDRIAPRDPKKKTGRHTDTQLADTEYSRRALSMETWEDADIVDKEDKLEIIHSPESEYAKAFGMGFARKIDDVIIDAAEGFAYEGKGGTVQVALPDSQKIVAHDGTTTTGVPLNVITLRAVKRKFNKNEAADLGQIYMAIDSDGVDQLLGDDKLTNADYAAIKALVDGEVNSFMGIKFIRTERLNKTVAPVTYNVGSGVYGSGTGTIPAGAVKAFAWVKEGIMFAAGAMPKTRVAERSDKSHAMQIYMSMTVGATRLEDVKVVQVIYKPI